MAARPTLRPPRPLRPAARPTRQPVAATPLSQTSPLAGAEAQPRLPLSRRFSAQGIPRRAPLGPAAPEGLPAPTSVSASPAATAATGRPRLCPQRNLGGASATATATGGAAGGAMGGNGGNGGNGAANASATSMSGGAAAATARRQQAAQPAARRQWLPQRQRDVNERRHSDCDRDSDRRRRRNGSAASFAARWRKWRQWRQWDRQRDRNATGGAGDRDRNRDGRRGRNGLADRELTEWPARATPRRRRRPAAAPRRNPWRRQPAPRQRALSTSKTSLGGITAKTIASCDHRKHGDDQRDRSSGRRRTNARQPGTIRLRLRNRPAGEILFDRAHRRREQRRRRPARPRRGRLGNLDPRRQSQRRRVGFEHL